MEKNRIRPIKTGKSFRMSYSRQEEVLEMPNLIEVQIPTNGFWMKASTRYSMIFPRLLITVVA